MSGRALSPEEFERTLVALVPQRVLPVLREVYFDAVTQVHERIVENTPVRTGYLRAGLQATAGSESPHTLPPRDPEGSYPADDAESIGAIARAAKTLDPLTIGFVAEYAPPVEDSHHMVKTARAEWPAMVERAIANQSAGSGEGS